MSAVVQAVKDRLSRMKDRGKELSYLIRGAAGMAPEESKYQWLIDLEDIRERTNLSEHDVYGHSLMQVAAREYDELEIWKEIADMEDHYFIAFEGEGRKLAALLQIGKREQTEAGTIAIQLPEVQTKPELSKKEEKKK